MPTNLVQNPGMEEGGAHWNTLDIGQGITLADILNDPATSHSGSWRMMVGAFKTAQGVTQGGGFQSDEILFPSGVRAALFNLWWKGTGPFGQNRQVRLAVLGNNSGTVLQSRTVIAPSTVWGRFFTSGQDVSIVLPSNDTGVYFQARTLNYGNSGGTALKVYIDDLTLYAVPPGDSASLRSLAPRGGGVRGLAPSASSRSLAPRGGGVRSVAPQAVPRVGAGGYRGVPRKAGS